MDKLPGPLSFGPASRSFDFLGDRAAEILSPKRHTFDGVTLWDKGDRMP